MEAMGGAGHSKETVSRGKQKGSLPCALSPFPEGSAEGMAGSEIGENRGGCRT